jgi:SAM-dependent methyltransferase
MARTPRLRQAVADNATFAIEAVRAGDLDTAFHYFGLAVEADKRNAPLRFNLAVTAEQIGEVEVAARELSQALRWKRDFLEAARRLSSLLRRYRLPDMGILDPQGLAAVLANPHVDRQPASEAAIAWLGSQAGLGAILADAEAGGCEEVARRLALRRTDELLRNELLLAAIAEGVVTDLRLERLLTALRRVLLLEAGVERLDDKALNGFALALSAQALNNGYVWVVSAEEAQALAAPLDVAALLAGDIVSGHRLLLKALYAPVAGLLGDLAARQCASLKPRALREMVEARLAEREAEDQIAAELPVLAPVTDATSRRVAAQTGRHPYPRWRSVQPAARGGAKRGLARFFAEERLAILDRPFEVLVAGCGTGKQAIDSALAFGPNARVLAIDVSRPSLAYAKRLAGVHNTANVEFAEADILGLAGLGRRFDVVLVSGALHHMADPNADWRALVSCLAPGGLMYVGIYSAIARKGLRALREDASFPGVGCSDDQARAFRQVLISRNEGEPGHELRQSEDFFTLPEFRDLVLNASEHHFTLPQIEALLAANGLVFRGFALDPHALERFAAAFPEEQWPGSLTAWARHEEVNPRLFEGMYQLWCEKVS